MVGTHTCSNDDCTHQTTIVPREEGQHPFTDADIAKCVESVHRYSEKPQKSLSLVPLWDMFNAEERTSREIVAGILPAGRVSIVGGEPGTGKTWLCLTMARDVLWVYPSWEGLLPNRDLFSSWMRSKARG